MIMIKALLVLFFLAVYPSAVNAEELYVEGKHYVLIGENESSESVEEIFSYFCIHCFRFQPVLTRLKERLLDRAVIKKTYISHVSSEAAQINSYLAKIRLIAIKNNNVDQLDKVIFNAFHVDKLDISSEKNINKIISEAGLESLISENALQETNISDQFVELKNRNLKLVGNKTIVSLPTLIVKGKYRVVISSLNKSDLENDLYGLINHLINK